MNKYISWYTSNTTPSKWLVPSINHRLNGCLENNKRKNTHIQNRRFVFWYEKNTHPETNGLPVKIGRNPIGKDRIPTIHFQGLLLLVSGRVSHPFCHQKNSSQPGTWLSAPFHSVLGMKGKSRLCQLHASTPPDRYKHPSFKPGGWKCHY